MNQGSIEPRVAQAPSSEIISDNQFFNVSCQGILLRNLGTDEVTIDDVMPMPEGDTYQESATYGRVMCYRMKITFAKAEGKTQKLLIRQMCDLGNNAANQ